jgi:DNA-binding NtrC family response regulator
MKTRHILAVDPQGQLSNQSLQITAYDQAFHRVESVVAAKKALSKYYCSVGLVVFDSLTPAFQDDIELLIATSPTTEWIALVSPKILEAKAFQSFILNAFHDYHTLPIEPLRLAMSIGHACGKARLRLALTNPVNVTGRFGIFGASPIMVSFFRQLEKVLQADLPVLISGESGTGKELVAQAIHDHSTRSEKPFIAVNCGAIPNTLIQSELFGHERGAFTGADKSKIGSIEAANGGVLFLDEICDLPLDLQGNLLRVLQERKITRLGSTREIPVDFRLVAATNVDLQEAIRAKCFREDLFYRLNVIQLQLPPLRERDGDVRILADVVLKNFVSIERNSPVTGFSAEAMRAMNAYHWPGNVRELINRVHRGVIMSDNKLLSASDLGFETFVLEQHTVTLEAARASFERDIVETSLRANGNNVAKTARQLGVSRVTLYRAISKLKIEL